MSMDDLYKQFEGVMKLRLKAPISQAQTLRNVAFCIASEQHSSNNEVVNIAHPEVSTDSSQGTKILPQTYTDDVMFYFFALSILIVSLCLPWRAEDDSYRRRRNLNFNGKETVGFDKTKVECYNCHRKVETLANAMECSRWVGRLLGAFRLKKASTKLCSTAYTSTEARIVIHQKNEAVYEEDIALLKYDVKTASKSLVQDSLEQPKMYRLVLLSLARVESDNENTRKSVIEQHTYRQAENLRKSQSPRVDKRNWNGIMTQKLGDGFEFNKKACFVCGSLNHLIKDCNFYENKMVGKSVLNNMGRVTGQREIRPVWNNAQRVNHQNKFTHPHPKRNFVPTAVVTKSGQVPVNTAKQSSPRAATSISTARPVNTAAPKSKVNNITTAGPEVVVITAKEKRENVVKSSACWIWRPTRKVIDHISKDSGSYMPKRFDYGNPQYTLQDQGIFDSGCSRHMTRNKSYLTDYQEVDGGFVAFAGSPKGGSLICLSCSKATIDEIIYRLGGLVARTMLADSLLPTTFWAEAVNTACYVQNRVLVTKPHNKTPYELLLGRPPSIRFMRPFRYHVTILNTLDPLGKFDKKADEGFLVRYFINNKAFRSGPEWLFDIDSLTKSMKYEPVTAGNQTNKNAVANDAGKKTNEEPAHEGERNGQKKEGGASNKENDQNVQDFRAELDNLLIQHKEGYANSTNKDSTVSPSVSTTGQNFTNADDLPTDLLILELEDTGIFIGAYDDEDVGAKDDLNNLETTMNVSLIPTTRIHKDYPKDQIIGDINSATQTRRMIKITEEHAMVWTLVDLPKGKRAIRTKWVYRNKKDKRGIIFRNKARLVAQGYTQEEGIDYDEVFAPIARIEAMRLFLAYASFMGLIVYQMDVKSAFLYGTIEEEVYVCQPPSFEDPQFPDKKKDGIFISQDKYVADILKKFDFTTVKAVSTPIKTDKALNKDEEAEDVDVYLYRSMIRSLMYLIASRLDIMFAVCACARFQVTPKTSHLHAVKRIFRYLKGQPKLGLWCPRDSPFDLEAFSDSDYAGASLDRKSTTRGCQFLGKRLISWQCKKQTVVANSTTEAEYVAAANCCGQVLWIQNQMLDYGFNFMNTKIYIDNESTICIVKNLVFHSKTKHIEIRHHFIRDSYEKKLIQVIKIHTDHNVADLLTKAFDVSRKAKRTTEISQSSGPIHLVADETVYKEWEDRMERAATTASSLEAEQDSGNINRTQSMATLNESFPQGTDSDNEPYILKTRLKGLSRSESIIFRTFIIMANLPPPNHVADLPKDNPEEQPELAPQPDHLNRFALHQNPQPKGNMNGWILEDDEEDEEEEDLEMRRDRRKKNDDMMNAEVINPYEEADPLNLPPPNSDIEFEDMAVAPTPVDHEQEAEANTIGTITRVPYYVRPFSGTFYVGSGSFRQVFAPGPTGRDVNTLHSQEFDTDLRSEIKGQHALRRSTICAPTAPLARYWPRADPDDPSARPTRRPRCDDPYVMVRDVAARDEGDDAAATSDP
ncbi:putative ribonuclease H-like domain-containing protein [Tanacetum coccineum]